jgi:Dolichyl-phosphate-mannose-protein mannosyltransferase
MNQGQTPSRAAQFWICAGFVLALALFLRLQGLAKSMWLDEYQSAYEFAGLTGIRHTLMMLRYDVHPPIYFLLLYLWHRLGGEGTETTLRLLTVAISMAWMALALVWVNAYRRSAMLIAGLILATQPFLIRYGQEIRDYGLLILFTVVAFYFTSAHLRTPGDYRYAALAGLAVAFAIGTHLIAIFLPVSILVFALTVELAGPETAPEALSTGPLRVVRKLAPLAASVIPIPAAVAFLLLRYFFIDIQQSIPTWISPNSIQHLALVGSTVLQIAMLPENWQPIALGLLLLSIALALVFGDWRLSLPFLAAAAAYCLQLSLYSLLGRPMLVDRYLLPGLILFIIWLSVQVVTIRSKASRWFAISSLALLSAMFAVNWVRSEAAIPVEAWKELGGLLPRVIDPDTQIFVQPDYSYSVFSHYAPAYPVDQIVKVPADNMTESFLNQSEERKFSHAILIFRATDVARVSSPFRSLLAEVRRRSVRPAVVEIYFVGPLDQEYFSTFLPLASTTLGVSPRASTDKIPISTARFELPEHEQAAEPIQR